MLTKLYDAVLDLNDFIYERDEFWPHEATMYKIFNSLLLSIHEDDSINW